MGAERHEPMLMNFKQHRWMTHDEKKMYEMMMYYYYENSSSKREITDDVMSTRHYLRRFAIEGPRS